MAPPKIGEPCAEEWQHIWGIEIATRWTWGRKPGAPFLRCRCCGLTRTIKPADDLAPVHHRGHWGSGSYTF